MVVTAVGGLAAPPPIVLSGKRPEVKGSCMNGIRALIGCRLASRAHRPGRGRWLAPSWLGMLAASVLAGATVSGAAASDASIDKTIVLEAVPGQMKYDKTDFSVAPGDRVKLVLKNPDSMQHNVVVCVKGDEELAIEVSKQAWRMDNPIANAYVPESDKILAASELVDPNGSDAIIFQVPEETGDYPYVCTFPGHAYTMKGTMHVGQGEPAKPVQLAGRLRDLTYEYYEGQWDNMPDFDKLDAKARGKLRKGRIHIGMAKRNSNFGLRFAGNIEVPEAGKYTFSLASDDGSQLYLDDELVVDNDGRHGIKLVKGSIDLEPGTHRVRIVFFQGGGGKGLSAAWQGPKSERVALSKNPKAAQQQAAKESFIVDVGSQPEVIRAGLPDASPRGIAVGLPGGPHFCFEASEGYVKYAWSGAFLNVGPERGNGSGRGGKTVNVLGDRFAIGAQHQPLRIGTERDDATSGYEFFGYRREKRGPVFQYKLDGFRIHQQVKPAPKGRGLRYTYHLEPTPGEPVFFSAGDEVTIKSASGEVQHGTLRVPADEAGSFSVTVLNPEK
jgi:plastocyanin